jgi:SOS-response transcriptional repressor LexA
MYKLRKKMKTLPLTKKQKHLYDFILKGVIRNPTWAQMKEFLGVTSSQTIKDYLTAIVAKGYKIPDRNIKRKWRAKKKTPYNKKI